MASVHSKNTYISVAGVDLSSFCDASSFTRKADKHDLTTYGKNDHVYGGGLGDGTFTLGGKYDNTTAGPRDTLEPLRGTVVTVVRRVEGTGSGLPQDSFSALLEEYVETSPVAEYVSWTAIFQPSDAVTSTNQ